MPETFSPEIQAAFVNTRIAKAQRLHTLFRPLVALGLEDQWAAKHMGIDFTTIYKWKRGDFFPLARQMQMAWFLKFVLDQAERHTMGDDESTRRIQQALIDYGRVCLASWLQGVTDQHTPRRIDRAVDLANKYILKMGSLSRYASSPIEHSGSGLLVNVN